MVPRTSSGRGFKGAAAYYLHDKGASTTDRLRFTHTLNLANDNPRRAVAEMIYTAEHANDLKAAAGVKATGRKLEKPVYTFSLSWHPTEKPTDQQMREAGIAALKALKMDRHQVLMVAHNDTDHPHIHLMVNRVDPETGVAHPLKKDHLILSKWAEKYEREHGRTWCDERVRNNAAREQAAQEKRRGRRPSAFVKDAKGQERDRRPLYDRRAKAIAEKSARGALARAQDAQLAARVAKDEARALNKRRGAFEAWTAAENNALQDRQNAARDVHARHYEARQAEAARKIERHYGVSKRQNEKRLAELIEREQKGSGLSRLVDRLRGYDQERAAIKRNLADIAQRSNEITAPIAKQEATARDRLQRQIDVQRRDQEALFERQRKAGYEIPDEEQTRVPEPERGQARDGGRAGRTRGGPERGR